MIYRVLKLCVLSRLCERFHELLVPKRQQTALTPNPTKIPSIGSFRICVKIKAAVPAIMDVIIH